MLCKICDEDRHTGHFLAGINICNECLEQIRAYLDIPEENAYDIMKEHMRNEHK